VTSFCVSTDDMRAFARAARSVGPDVAAGLRKGVKSAADLVRDDAKSKASFSTRIPRSITSKASAGAVASVTAGGRKAPDAAPLENGGRCGKFRHPVNAWATKDRAAWKWGEQTSRPFLHPALEDQRETAVGLIAAAVDEGLLRVLGI
jgi:hypothetical protein